MIDYRMEAILNYLQEVDSSTGDALGRLLNVSSKTAMAWIRDLDRILGRYGASIKATRAKGYTLVVSDEDAFADLRARQCQIHLNHIPNTTQERMQYIAISLLRSNLLNIDDTCAYLLIGRNEFRCLMKKQQDYFQKFGMRIDQSEGYYYLQGNSQNWLKVMADYLYRNRYFLKYEFSDVFEKKDKVERCLERGLEGHTIYYRKSMKDSVILLLTLFTLSFTCSKFQGHWIPEPENQQINQEFLQVAQIICAELEKEFQIQIPANEITFIGRELMCRCDYGIYVLTHRGYSDYIYNLCYQILAEWERSTLARMALTYHFPGYLTGLMLRNENKVCPVIDYIEYGILPEYALESSRKILCSEYLPEIRYIEEESLLLASVINCFYESYMKYMNL